MKYSRQLLAAVCLLLTALCVGCDAQPTAASYPDPTDRFYVNDFADILTDADEQTVFEAGVKLAEATEAQVVLLTVDNIGDDYLENYALEIARGWGIGDADKDNGILLLFTVDGPHSRLEIGYGLEGAVPDSKAGLILDTYLVPWYDDKSAWSAQLTDTYRAVVNEVYAEYGMIESQLPLDTPLDEDDAGDLVMLIPMLLVLMLILSSKRGIFFLPRFGAFYGGFGGSHHHRGGGFGGGFGGGGGFSGGGGGFGGGGASR